MTKAFKPFIRAQVVRQNSNCSSHEYGLYRSFGGHYPSWHVWRFQPSHVQVDSIMSQGECARSRPMHRRAESTANTWSRHDSLYHDISTEQPGYCHLVNFGHNCLPNSHVLVCLKLLQGFPFGKQCRAALVIHRVNCDGRKWRTCFVLKLTSPEWPVYSWNPSRSKSVFLHL